ncbi:peptidyl-prolyl cis-trans isomerase FKBP11 [Neopsephotus bourkii]|uniref:peptidyl-prolyl cis-trans isomerase FKBP11 n=1 Tax=Neopsephotus bourkii TaxID=309878 RepID=UPI002AA502AD|nr:peptidyl-prolyl cis-trans isomerase FKBP11 [Neopsephotus bourkii]
MPSSGSCAGACDGNGAAVTGVGEGCWVRDEGRFAPMGAGSCSVPISPRSAAACWYRSRCRCPRTSPPPGSAGTTGAVTGQGPVLGGSPGWAAPEHGRTRVPDTGGGNHPLRPHRGSLRTGPGAGGRSRGRGGARGEHGAGRGGPGAAAASPAMPSPAALLLLLLVLLLPPPARVAESETETGARDLRLETLVPPPEGCTELSAPGDTVHIHYTGSLEDDGRIIDTSLSRDPLQVELGKRQVIPGLEQSLLDMCVGEKRRVIIPPHLAYGKRGSPPSIPGDAVLRFEVELVALSRAGYWQKVLNKVVPLLCLGLVPALLGLIGCHLYHKASSTRLSKKKMKEEKKNKAKRK